MKIILVASFFVHIGISALFKLWMSSSSCYSAKAVSVVHLHYRNKPHGNPSAQQNVVQQAFIKFYCSMFLLFGPDTLRGDQ